MPLGVVAFLLLVGALVLAVRLPGLRHDLDSGRASLTAAQDALGRGDRSAARAQVERAGRALHDARATTDGPLWSFYAHVPLVGTSVREVRAVSRAADATAGEVLPALLSVDPGPVRWTGRVDAAPFLAARAPLAQAQTRLRAVRQELRAAPYARIGVVERARVQLDDALTRLARSVTEARAAAQAVPEIVSGSKTYLLAVQNNAEQRATGGLLGAYGVLTVRDGALRLERVGPNQDLRDPDRPVIDLGAEYDQRYGRFATTRTWRSANLSPDTPTVGRLLAALWRQQTGSDVDGVVLVDPVGLAALLGATGPVTLDDGTRLTEQNAAQVMLVDAYRRFPRTQDADRNAYLQGAARRVFGRLTQGGFDGRRLVQRIALATGSGHLQVWSAHASVQRDLLPSRAAGALAVDGPFLEVVTQDVGGSKLGVYQERTVRYVGRPTGEATDLGTGPVAEERATVSVTLANRAPSGLPSYVTLRPDDPRAPVGQSKTWLSVYLGAGATLRSATLDGKPVAVETLTEQGLSVFSLFLTLDRGASSTLVLDVLQPAEPGQALLYRQQPLLRPDRLEVRRGGAPLDRYYSP